MSGKLPFESLDRKILIRSHTKTSQEFGKFPEDRSIQELLQSSVICVNKPSGPTSHQVADYVKKLLNADKVGHAGTLDPLPTGVLPLALNNATKVVQALLPAGKEYIATMYLHDDIPEEKIRKELQEYIGTITQLPPVKSSVKRELRERTIYYIDILEIEGRNVLFRMGCQGGTYVRKYIHDFGLRLNSGAHMKELIRTKAGPFTYHDWVSLTDIQDAFAFYTEGKEEVLKKILLPVEKAVEHLPKVFIADSAVGHIAHGAMLYVGGIVKVESCVSENSLVAVLSLKNELVCLGTSRMSAEQMIKLKQGVAVKTERVFMDLNTYPKTIVD